MFDARSEEEGEGGRDTGEEEGGREKGERGRGKEEEETRRWNTNYIYKDGRQGKDRGE